MSDVMGVSPQRVAALAEAFAGGVATTGLRRLCEVAVDATGASAAAVLATRPGQALREVVGTDARAEAVARVQLASGRGPSIDAFRTGTVVVAGARPSGADPTWPEFGASCAEAGFASAWSVPLAAAGQRLGALGMLRERAGPVPDRAVADSRVLANLAAALLAALRRREEAQRLVQQLKRALTTRILIEQAKGRLVERHDLSAEAAFERLRRHARDHNLRIHGVAAAVARGELQL